jgi:hypothetical protein
MRHPTRSFPASLCCAAAISLLAVSAFAQDQTLTWIPGSSVKLYQINGECDWPEWDATINKLQPTCVPTASQTITRGDIVGDDVAYSFESNGQLVMTFGDTIGAYSPYSPTWTSVVNPYAWGAHDPIGFSNTLRAEDGLLLTFPPQDGHAQEILPSDQPDGKKVQTGPDDVANGGINLNGKVYLAYKTGTVVDPATQTLDHSKSYNVLVAYDESTETFTSGRTISALPGGHFITTAFAHLKENDQWRWSDHDKHGGAVLTFGTGDFRASNVYLSITPTDSFETGVDSHGNSTTRYLSGWNHGWPMWSQHEADATPIVTDIDPAHPAINNVSAFYSPQLGLWLMTFDSFYGSAVTTHGTYFTYAKHPWGPWKKPQQIFNSCRDHGLGTYMRYHYENASLNDCPSAMPPGNTATSGASGPAGPTIGDQTKNDPNTTRGGEYAPLMVERFTEVEENRLKIFYTLSTWNPYAVVLMESDFTIGHNFDDRWLAGCPRSRP